MAEPRSDSALLTGYLLDRLPADRRRELEARYFEDDRLYDELLAAADDLLEAYLHGELAAADREQVREHLLRVPWWRDRFEGLQLLTRIARPAESQPAPPPPRTRRYLGWAGAAATVLLALLATRAVLTARRPIVAPAEVVAERLAPEPVRESPAPPPARAEAPAPVPSLMLGESSYRDEGALPWLVVPASARQVRMVIEVDVAADEHYRVELRSVAGARLAVERGHRAARARGERPAVTVTWPARLLSPNDYTVAVLSPAEPSSDEPLAEYAFRVRARE